MWCGWKNVDLVARAQSFEISRLRVKSTDSVGITWKSVRY